MEKISSIQVHQSTKERLMELGKMGDTYESIIIMLLDEYEKKS